MPAPNTPEPASPAGDADLAPELAHELERLSRASVMVLGDVSLERRVHGSLAGNAGRLVLGMEEAEGGAGAAIVRALAGLRVATALICVLGDDLPGAQLTALIGAQPNVEPWLLVDGAKASITETAYLDGGRVVLRTLRHDVRPMQPLLRERMLRIAGDAMTATSVTILSDRGHGTLDAETVRQVLAGARQVGRRVIADLEGVDTPVERFRGCDAVVRLAGGDDAEAQAREIRRSADFSTVLLVGSGDLIIADRDGVDRLPIGGLSEPISYARVVAILAASLAVGRTPRAACRMARAYLFSRLTPRAAPP